MIRGISFDLYGTLNIYGDMEKARADRQQYFYKSLTGHGLKMPGEQIFKECERFADQGNPVSCDPKLTVFENRIRDFYLTFDIDLSSEETSSIADDIVRQWQEYILPDRNAIPVLKELHRSKKLALISNFDHPRHVREYIAQSGFDMYFSEIVISGEAGVRKPDPDIFKTALTTTGLEPCEVVHVGDAVEDVEAARAAGITPVFIRRNDEVSDRYPRPENYKTISSLRELLSIYNDV